ncbi:MAG: DUF3617 family protein [Thermodesulforhabdaceae bacterium]
MGKRFLFILGVFSLVFTSFVYGAEMNLKEGLWEITVQVSSPDMPMQMPAQKFTQCITKDNSIPEAEMEKNKDCKIEQKNISGDTVSWKLVCQDGEEKIVSEGKVTYKGDTFVGESVTKTSDGMEMRQKMTGKWIGKCSN